MSTLTLNSTFIINSPVTKVWDALVNPEVVKKYFFGTEMKSDFRVGSPITFSGVWDGKPYEDKGTILKYEKERILKYNYWSNFTGEKDEPENYCNVTYEVSAQGNKTTLTITQDKFKTIEAKEHSEKNWAMLVDAMKELLEGGN